MNIPDTIQITITKELVDEYEYYDVNYCPIAQFLKEKFENAYILVGADRIYINQKSFNLKTSFTITEYLEVAKTGKPFVTTIHKQ